MIPIIDVKGLSVTYQTGGRPVVDDVSFMVTEGSTLGIIGESGAGKTTLALALSGLIDHAMAMVTGTITYAGHDLLNLDEASLCRLRGAGISMIFQDASGSLDPSMPVVDQVTEAVALHQQTGDKSDALKLAQRILNETGLDAHLLAAAPYAHQLSGGLCQRAMIAAAIACQPKVLVADEPTSSLDVITQSQIVSLIDKQQRDLWLTLIFISHDLAIVSNISAQLLVMQEGRVVDLRPTAETACGQHPT